MGTMGVQSGKGHYRNFWDTRQLCFLICVLVTWLCSVCDIPEPSLRSGSL